MIWKKIQPFRDVEDIKIASSKIQPFWSKFEINEYIPTTLIAKFLKIIECLVHKKVPWTNSKQSIQLLYHTFISLTKISPEVILGDGKKSGDLYPSPTGPLWTAAIKVLGCSFSLQVQVMVAAKSILKNNMKHLKLQRKSLTVDPACVPTKTKISRLLTSRELC